MKKRSLLVVIIFFYILCTIENNAIVTFLIWGSVIVALLLSKKSILLQSICGTDKTLQNTIIISLLFTRLVFFQVNIQKDYDTLGCRHTGQEIDIVIHGSISQNISSKQYIYSTRNGNFFIQGYLNPQQKELLINTSGLLTINGIVQCLGPSSLHPFSRESGQIANNTRGGIIKIYTLTEDIDTHNKFTFLPPHFLIGSQSETEETKGIIRGIVLGDTSQMTKNTYQYFLDSGLIYLVSASGGNIILLIFVISKTFFFIPIRLRKYLILVSIFLYFFSIGTNVAFLRAYIAFILGYMCIPSGYLHSKHAMFFTTLYCMTLFNPLYIVSSWGLLLSIAGIRGLLHIPPQTNKFHLTKQMSTSFFANIGLIGPLLFLIGHINLLTIFLSLIAAPLTNIIFIFYFISWVPYTTIILSYAVRLLYKTTVLGSTYGLFLSVGEGYILISYFIRISTRILLVILYTSLYKKHILSLRD